ncbi:Ribosomal RNA large subunit methyltransferase I [Georgfuchsia toluolica]|uniref:Ribosomal RNA large subunit methyltransferase I n=1 Tax=Georgfuchsia toluolica TaxID=424218 RepID=A0A916J5E4_9PROT|nr:class I SAM-dependent methyltransferase [Georgfuchsia toluolica]CAG4884874.1 Ribosomal RNA large subunit methyltransferase I [Georgfuchsia toluolica]
MPQLILHPDKERSLLRRHPWLFASSVAHLSGRARPGDTVKVVADNGKVLGKAAWSPASQIRARMWSFDVAEIIDDAFFKRRVAAAVARRVALPELHAQQALRLIHAESDGLPGVIADRYGDTIVLALTSAGAEKWRAAIVGALKRSTGCTRIYERSDSEVRKLEGLEPTTGWLEGEGETRFAIDENGVRLLVDIAGGHKTGFYLDQRDNRLLLRGLANVKRVLNCFCYSGGFSLQALAGGAREVISIDSSAPALDLARENMALNTQLDAARAGWRDADVFSELRQLREAGEQFDIVVLDPPKFAPSASHADRAARAYKDINLLGFRLLAPGGLLMTYSCSGGIGLELFQKIVAGAALDAGREARIIKRLQGSADHPVALAFPEGEYLKGLLVQVD